MKIKEFYKNKDFQGMEKEYKKIRNNLEKLVPIENTINAAKKIEVLHNLIKNNGQNFNLTEEQIELAKKLNWVIEKNKEYFKKVKPRGETIEWENGEDICPENLYYDSKLI